MFQALGDKLRKTVTTVTLNTLSFHEKPIMKPKDGFERDHERNAN